MIQDSFASLSQKHVVILGYGSIGQRHARLFVEIGANVTVVSRRSAMLAAAGITFVESLTAIEMADYVILASETSSHVDHLIALADYDWFQSAICLVEKPLVGTVVDLHRLVALPNSIKDRIYVGFNLRFLPVVQAAWRALPKDIPLLRADFQSHSYLPQWRPNRDFLTTSSAQRRSGGGVLRDLSHELDLAYWFCGPLQHSHIVGGRLSSWPMDVEDTVLITAQTESCGLVSIGLSYTQHIETRSLTLITEHQTILADLMTGDITIATEQEVNRDQYSCPDFDETYRAMHAQALSSSLEHAADFSAGQESIRSIETLSKQIDMHQ